MSNRNVANVCLAAQRYCIGVALAFAAAAAQADSAAWAYASASAAPEAHHGAAEMLIARLDPDSQTRNMRYDADSLHLVDADEQFRRQDASFGAKGPIAVIYPDIGGPFQTVFAKIIEGIEAQVPTRVVSVPVGAHTAQADLNAQLKRNSVKAVIALGRQGLKAAAGVDRDIPVVVGGVLSVPEAESRNLTGVTLTPDPALLFLHLKALLPHIKRVIVVYDPQRNETLIRLAREAARTQGLELVAYEASDLASAVRNYNAAFAFADNRRDAFWLPQDPTTVDDNTVLPLVLKECWNRNAVFFSSSYLHVKKGALFTLYPNNVELGRTLATSALSLLAGENRKRGMVPLREMHTAINLRTANHIGLNLSYQQQRGFDHVFPEP